MAEFAIFVKVLKPAFPPIGANGLKAVPHLGGYPSRTRSGNRGNRKIKLD
jgi:hypothetical protein